MKASHRLKLILVLALALVLAGAARPAAAQDAQKPVALVTMTMLGDMVRNVAGDRVDVRVLLPVGMDPHTYEPRPGDVQAIADSQLVFYNGLGIELWLDELLTNAGGQRPHYPVTAGLERLAFIQTQGGHAGVPDPHMWMNVRHAIRYVENIRDALIDFDPSGRAVYTANAERYSKDLEAADVWVRAQVATIPPPQRKLVTSHDAFRYYGEEYGLDVVGTVWGISTDEEPSAEEIARLVNDMRAHGVPAAFVETSVNPRLLERVAAESGITIGGTLYSDSLGPAGSPGDTYIKMIQANTQTIVSALGGTPQAAAVGSPFDRAITATSRFFFALAQRGILPALFEPLGYAFMVRALLASIIVGILCGAIGCYIILRRMALIGDALSHAVLPGVAIARLLDINFFIGAVATGILTALGIGFVQRRSKVKEDTAIGVMFTVAFAFGILLLSTDAVRQRAAGVDLFHILFGNVLGVSTTDLLITLATGLLVLATIAVLYKEFLMLSFDPTMAAAIGLNTELLHYLMMLLLSLTIVASLQTVGVILVVALLVIPAATAYLLTQRLPTMMLMAAGQAVISAIVGLYASFYFDVSSGATIVLTSGLFFFLSLFFAPRTGLVARWLRTRRARRVTDLQDALKAGYQLAERGRPLSEAQLAAALGVSSASAARTVENLRRAGWASGSGDSLQLTAEGEHEALQLVRSHRLWEQYLVDEAGQPVETVHEQAHGLEHITTPAMAETLAESLGHPQRDPHGDPIPDASGALPRNGIGQPLTSFAVGAPAVVVHVEDEPPAAFAQLVVLGFLPGKTVTVTQLTPDAMTVAVDGRQILLALPLAESIAVEPITPNLTPGSQLEEPDRLPSRYIY